MNRNSYKPSMANINQEHTKGIDVADSFRLYCGEEYKHIDFIENRNEENDLLISTELKRVVGNVESIIDWVELRHGDGIETSVQEVVDSFRTYYSKESNHINTMARDGDESDKIIAREISRVIDNIDRICRIAECYAEKNGY